MTLAAATALLSKIPATGCSAEYLRQITGLPVHSLEESLHQLVTAGLAIRRDNRYLRRVDYPTPEPEPAPNPHLRIQIPPAAVTDEEPDPDDDSQEIHVKHTCNRCDRDDLAASEMCIRNGKPSRICKACFAASHAGKHATGAAAKAPKTRKPAAKAVQTIEASTKARRKYAEEVKSLQDVVQKHAPRQPAIAAALAALREQHAQITQAIAALEPLA